MTAQTFIFVHDEQIVLDYIAAGKFNQLPDVKYVFLGQRPTDRIKHLDNVVVARDLPHNIEHLPNLVAWTGWYAVLRNDLITADWVNLFEYDINVIGKWEQPEWQQGYFAHFVDAIWWDYNGIKPVLQRILCGSDVGGLVPMTSNYTLSYGDIEEVLRDILWQGYATLSQAGHIAERHCSFMLDWVAINEQALTHLYADSHGTQGRGDRYNQIKSQLL